MLNNEGGALQPLLGLSLSFLRKRRFFSNQSMIQIGDWARLGWGPNCSGQPHCIRVISSITPFQLRSGSLACSELPVPELSFRFSGLTLHLTHDLVSACWWLHCQWDLLLSWPHWATVGLPHLDCVHPQLLAYMIPENSPHFSYLLP